MPNPPGFTPQSLNWASDTHQLPSDPSPQHTADPFGNLGVPGVFSDDVFNSCEEHDLDWIFQNITEDDEINFNRATADRPAHECFDPALKFGETPLNAQQPASTYQENDANKESWLLDGATPPERPLAIPRLGGERVDQLSLGSHCQLECLTEADRKQVQQFIKLSLERPLWKSITMECFPSKEKLDHCVDLFFINWRPAVNFIHRPTFNPNRTPEILVLAIASIGARFTRLSGAAQFATTLAEVVRRLSLSAVERDPDITKTEPYLTAQLLLGMYGYCSGDKTLFNYSESLRSSLVRHGRNFGLFSPHRATRPIENNTQAQWAAWINAERRKRLGWAIYEFDASVSFLHNRRPTMSVGDILLSLPEDAARWEATSAHAWMALVPQRSTLDDAINFRIAARSCFDTKLAVTIELQDPQHLHLIVITLARFLWSIKELQASPLMDVVPEQWPLVAHKINLLHALDHYSVPLSTLRGMSDDKELARQVERTSIIHICHLYGANDLMDWLPALLRTSGLNKAAKERMKVWGEEDPVRLRKVAYHSAQVMTISRDFPFNGPYEPFHVFYAGAALWCVASLLAEPQEDEVLHDSQRPIFLDRHATAGDVDHLRILKWIQEGGNNAVVGIYGVPVLGSRSSRIQALAETIRILQNMRSWDLSTAFVNVLRQLLNAESAYE
ncbi:uncharacterized protein A1O5_13243 [Cladophialophora psammophila CBS 110553]|uniref:Xylanolytic transcriptional activator regulatory domain-containing protein n=1 Tax=Cladophialophora psammophila CBS 110553 TaxID=1182543 RepID=W9VCY5_9EURO|nr:uncharacterized protein A1O5_13243 [Cladophialophora psammophila CBS 110553]EXJ53467.1 hypothetical protein A1O5_13243 [Cladophialophora psammophila CBS 110553]